MTNFFNKEFSEIYDERNSRLAPIMENLHFLVRLILKDLPRRARILCVGVGTGAEILALSSEYPEWLFVGIDPSTPMLDVCRARLEKAGVADRCELICGHVRDLPDGESFDAVLSILVAHFVRHGDRAGFYKNIQQRLKAGGYFVSAEISFDLNAAEFPFMLKNWERVQACMGATPESLQALPAMLRETLCVLSPSETEALLRASGVDVPVRFFQSFMVSGWFGRKGS